MRKLKLLISLSVLISLPTDYSSADDQLMSLGTSVSDVQQSSALLYTLSRRDNLSLSEVLAEMKNHGSVAKNWYLSLAQAIADRNVAQSEKECQKFVEQLGEDSSARYWAFTFLTRRRPELKESLLQTMLNDPSLDLRFEAVELQLKRLEQSPPASADEKQAEYRKLLAAARLPEQVQQVAKLLEELEVKVDLLDHFGFLARWHTIGPFDNSQQSGFDVVYGPEQDYITGKLVPNPELLKSDEYQGKAGSASWQELITAKGDGAVDLQKPYDKAKGSIIYALGSFQSPGDIEAEVRIGSQNAVKVWVNGQPVISREVYHAGGQIDQYNAPVSLRSGVNSVLVKVCQNEQTEPWAQDHYFQLRFCDASGLAIRSLDSPKPKL